MITLSAKLSSDLDWPLEKDPEGTYHLDFGWQQIDPYNPVHLEANLLAVEQFAKQFPDAKKAVLAITSGQFSNIFRFSETILENAKETQLNFDLFCAELFSEYLQRLISPLPEETVPIVLFEINVEAPISQLVLLLSKRRFEHLEVAFSDRVIPIDGAAKVIVSLPQDSLYEPNVFDQIFSSLGDIPFKCIPEELLNEHWDGVDFIVVHRSTLGDIGQRMLYGFEAAGGETIESGKELERLIKNGAQSKT